MLNGTWTLAAFHLSTCIFSTIYRTIAIWLKKFKKSWHENRQITETRKFLSSKICVFSKIFKCLRKFWKIIKSRYKTTSLPRLGNFWVSVEKFFSVLYRRSISLKILQVINSITWRMLRNSSCVYKIYFLSRSLLENRFSLTHKVY